MSLFEMLKVTATWNQNYLVLLWHFMRAENYSIS